MTSARAGARDSTQGGTNWATAVASLAVGAAFLALWFWLLPSWLGFVVDMSGVARWRWIAALVAVVGINLFVRLCEEPTLRGRFGADYEEYCRNVRRWIPRMRAWNQ